MSKKILILSDGDTWEELNDEMAVVEITDAAFEEVMGGMKPKNLQQKHMLNGARVSHMWEETQE